MKRSTLRHAALRVVAASSLAACSAASDIHYEYEKIGVSTDRGFFNVTLNPEPARKEVDGEMRIVWSSPYLFNTQYITLEDAMLLKGEIRNLVLTNAETGQVVVEEDYVLDTRRKAERPGLGRSSETNRIWGRSAGFAICGLSGRVPVPDHGI